MTNLPRGVEMFDGLWIVSVSKVFSAPIKQVQLFSKKTGNLIWDTVTLDITDSCLNCKHHRGDEIDSREEDSTCDNFDLNYVVFLEERKKKYNVIPMFLEPWEFTIQDDFPIFQVKPDDVCTFWNPIDPLWDYQNRGADFPEKLY